MCSRIYDDDKGKSSTNLHKKPWNLMLQEYPECISFAFWEKLWLDNFVLEIYWPLVWRSTDLKDRKRFFLFCDCENKAHFLVCSRIYDDDKGKSSPNLHKKPWKLMLEGISHWNSITTSATEALFALGIVHKLHLQELGLWWPPTHLWLTFVKEFLY